MTIEPFAAREFLRGRRLAVVGASDDPGNFGRTICRELKNRGYDVAAVNPNAASVLGDTCYPDLASVPGSIDGVIVMVPRRLAAGVVAASIERGVARVWLFKGLGAGSVSDDAVALCRAGGVEVIAGACPLMFLDPVGGIHKFHGVLRRLNGSVARAA